MARSLTASKRDAGLRDEPAHGTSEIDAVGPKHSDNTPTKVRAEESVGCRTYADPPRLHWPGGPRRRWPACPHRAKPSGTLLHELTHWSGALHRLDRTFGTRFGDNDYAVEELVAELGAAFLCADLGIANEPRPDQAAYVVSWLEVLNDDRRALFIAAARANDAAIYLQGFSEP